MLPQGVQPQSSVLKCSDSEGSGVIVRGKDWDVIKALASTLQMCPCIFSPPYSSVIKSSSFSILGMLPFLSFFSHCCEVMSPWHEDKNALQCARCSICRPTRGSCANLNRDGHAAEHLPLSNYTTASRKGELHLHKPFKVPNISFLFILNLFVQRSPFKAHYILSSGGDWRRKQWVVSSSNPRMCQVDCITSDLDPSEAFFMWTSVYDSQHQLEKDLHVFMFYLGSVWENRCSSDVFDPQASLDLILAEEYTLCTSRPQIMICFKAMERFQVMSGSHTKYVQTV